MKTRIETGIIQEIKDCSENDRTNKVVMLKLNKEESIAIQFQGKRANILDGFKENTKVSVAFKFKAKKSNMERFYNNLIGKSIKLQNDKTF